MRSGSSRSRAQLHRLNRSPNQALHLTGAAVKFFRVQRLTGRRGHVSLVVRGITRKVQRNAKHHLRTHE